ncbi:MAG: DUF4878 domain-containing protein [Mycobacterium sp.]|jgi:hypothetical protein
MSNPSGTDPADDVVVRRPYDDDPVTEVIDIYADPNAAEAFTGERRYTAPGFDAGFTQIIDRVPDPPTEVFGAHEGTGARHRTVSPRSIPPRPRLSHRPKWLLPAILLILGLIVATALGVFLMKRSAAAARAAQENAVRTSIESFDTAIRKGDLATLRSITCGQSRDAYVNYDQNAWADTYARVSTAKQYPVVASIDEVVVNGDHAEANVTSYLASDPATRSTRSFDLQFRDDQWKICQAS